MSLRDSKWLVWTHLFFAISVGYFAYVGRPPKTATVLDTLSSAGCSSEINSAVLFRSSDILLNGICIVSLLSAVLAVTSLKAESRWIRVSVGLLWISVLVFANPLFR